MLTRERCVVSSPPFSELFLGRVLKLLMTYMMNRSPFRRISPWLVKVFALILSQTVMHAGPDKGAGSANFPKVQLRGNAHGIKAVRELGARLPEVARAYGLRHDELHSLLLEDEHMVVDAQGRLHFTDPIPPQGVLPADGGTTQPALAPLSDTFKLHSRPGAKRILFLDFDGHILSGTGWNSSYNGGRDIVAPPWDFDGNPSVFGDVERTRIQQIWQRVAEDYAPFDVDVTTELTSEAQITRTSSSDEYYGTRVLVSAISSFFGTYGGVAYVGAFDDVGDQYKPALVFPENLGPNHDKFVAEAISHEAGHNLGLNHDGTASVGYYSGQGSGTTGWAPIMGAGYYQNLSQWSKGEYAGANNTQNDISVMQTYGLPLRVDDYGNTAAAAAQFASGTGVTATGVIERETDVDVFGFTTGAGPVSFTLWGADLGPNLDIVAEIRDINGALLAANNPEDQLYAMIDATLPAGNYYLHVRGTGWGDPLTVGYTRYGSLGQYWLSGTLTANAEPTPPVARATATLISGTTPLVVQFNGAGSSDADGSIVSYSWNFGDGTSATGLAVSHTYSVAGTYTATLTVTDNTGLTSSTSLTIQAQAPAMVAMHVQSIALTVLRQTLGNSVRATVKVVDPSGQPVSGAVVSGSFNSIVSGSGTATTDSSGHAILTSRRVKKSGTVAFTVTNVGKAGYAYNPSQNLQTSATIVVR